MENDYWTPVTTDVSIISANGQRIVLRNVPGLKDKQGNISISIVDAIRTEQEYIAKEHGINPREILELLILQAPVRFSKCGPGYLEQKFRFNKILFYIWKKLEEQGLDAVVFEKFSAARAGPIPIHLKEDLNELEEKGLITQSIIRDKKEIPRGEGGLEEIRPKGSLRCELTNEGAQIAKSIWDKTPPEIRDIVKEVKETLFFVDATILKEKVRKDYPEYQKHYTELDDE